MTGEKYYPPQALERWWLPASRKIRRRRAGIQAARSVYNRWAKVGIAMLTAAVVQDAVTGYRPIKPVAAMPTSMVYAIDTIVAEMTIFNIFGSLAHEGRSSYSRGP